MFVCVLFAEDEPSKSTSLDIGGDKRRRKHDDDDSDDDYKWNSIMSQSQTMPNCATALQPPSLIARRRFAVVATCCLALLSTGVAH